jgi:undecaprenyl-diphosphatase
MPSISVFQVIVLAIVQGLAELLPVSSSAHVVVAEKLMGLDPTSPAMTLILVMLHTGTMFAVIVYFWKRWAHTYFRSGAAFQSVLARIVAATVLTGVVGYPIQKVIEKTMFHGAPKAEIEQLFGRLDLIAVALFLVGILILVAGLAERRSMIGRRSRTGGPQASADDEEMTMGQAGVIGAVQGLSLPFRGFSRSGSTISAGMLAGVNREHAETFSFALAVVLTPAVLGREALRLLKATHEAAAAGTPLDLHGVVGLSVLGLVLAFVAGLAGLKWLSSWLESGKWWLFGLYCLVASVVVFGLHLKGY